MSEKRVNVKITASVSEFNKAIEKAQKQIKELTDALDDINKNKFGDNLEKQFKNITDAAEKMQEQLEDMKDTLEDIEKIKLDKTEKELENTSEAAEDLNKKLEDTKDSVEDLAKAKLDKLEQQYKDVMDANDKLNEKIEDNQEALSELDEADMDKLRRSLESINDSTEDLDDRFSDLRKQLENLDSEGLDKLDNDFKEVGSAVEGLGDKVRDTADDIDRHLNNSLEDTTDRVEKVSDHIEDMGDKLSKVDGLEDVGGNFNKIFDDKHIKVKLDGDGDNFLKNITEDTIGTSIGTRQLSDSVQGIVDSVDRLVDSMRDMNQFTLDEQIKNYDEFINDMVKAQDEYNKALEKSNELNEKIADTQKKIDYASEKELQPKIDEQKKLKEEYEEYKADLEELINVTNKLSEATADWANRNEIATKAYVDQEKVVQDLEKELNDLVNADTGMQRLKDECEDARRAMERLEDEARGLGLSFKMDANGNKLIDTSNYEKAGRELDSITEKIRRLQDSLSRRSDFSGFLDKKGIQDEEIRDLANAYKQLWDEIDSGENIIENCAEEMRDLLDAMVRIDKESGAFGGYMQAVKSWFNEYQKASEEADRLTNVYYSQMSVIDDLTAAQERYNKALKDYEGAESQIDTSRLDEERSKLEDLRTELAKLEGERQVWHELWVDAQKASDALGITGKSAEELQDEFDNTEKRIEELSQDIEILEEALNNARKEVAENSKELDTLNADLDALNETLEKGNKFAKEQADAFNDEYKAYEKLSKKVKEYLEDEEKSILLREKVAKSFKQVSDAMESVYKDSGKLNNADLITKTLADAADYIKELDLVSTDNLQRDLTRLGEIIDDKTEKIKRFKELNKTFGSDDGKTAHWLEQEAKAIKEFVDKTGIAIEAADTLRKAWGDVSIGGEDHLKLRARAEALSNYGETIKQQVREIRKAYQDLDSLDDMLNSDKVSDKDKLVIKDYQAWEKSREELIKYNKAIEDYIVTIRDANGQISDKFLTDGKFDIDKFIADFDKMGASSAVLSKQFNANKIALQEWLKVEKEARKAAVENAKLALEQAKADEKAAKSKEEIREATERVAKAQEELADARKKLKDFSIDASKEIKELNELAESMRKLGMAAEDLGKSDVAKFDKSLASLLDSLDAFGKGDFSFNFDSIKEDFMGIFADMDSFDFGGIWDGVTEIGTGILAALPTDLKLAAAGVTALSIALKECAEAGVGQFTRGMDTLKNALSGIFDFARDVGQEIGDAFSSVTGMDLDFSSLMQIPIEFEAQMARVAAIAGVTDEEFKKLEETARKLGATTPFSASEVAEAMEYMGQAGWGYEEIKNGIEGVLQLATIAEMELGQASEFVTDAINTFPDMEVKDAAHLVDVLAKVSVKTSSSVAQMQRAFTNCAPVAGTLGISVEDLSMALGLMANQGVKGAKAGTAMKNLMTNLSTPTEKQLAYIKKFNLEGAQQAIVNGDLISGIKQMKQALSGLTPQQQNAVIATIAGREALSGVSALLNSTTEDITDLESAINNCGGSAAEMADDFEKTLKGALNNLAGALEETTLQIFDKVEGSVASVINELTKFINILNGIEQSSSGLTGIAGALEYLEEVSRGWGKAIEDGIVKSIGAINDFINGVSFDNLLQAGSNIISGICNGILEAADNGTLGKAISGFIKKVSVWISENMDLILDAGEEIIDAISEGISENGDEIGEVIEKVMELQTDIDKAIAHEKWKIIGGNIISFIAEGIVSKVSVLWNAITGAFSGFFDSGFFNITDFLPTIGSPMKFSQKLGFNLGKEVLERAFDFDFDLGGIGDTISNWFSNVGKWISDAWSGLWDSIPKIESGDILKLPSIGDLIDYLAKWFKPLNVLKAIKDTLFAKKDDGDGSSNSVKPKDIIKLPSIKECVEHIKNWFNGLSIVKTIKEALSKNNKDTSDNKIKPESIIKIPSIKEIKSFISEKLSGFNLLETMKNLLLGTSKLTGVGKATSFIKMADLFGDWDPVQDAKNWLDEKIGNWSITKWIKDKFSGSSKDTGKKTNNKKSNNKTETEEINVDTLININTKELKAIEESLKALQTAAQSAAGVIRENFLSMANVTRNQMLNISNIIRNQAISWANIIGNQILNARNAFTTQMLSMASVARTQMLNITNIIRNQSMSWANIIRNQITNARNGFTSQMISMASVARTQMVNVSNIIRNQSLSWANVISNQAKRARDAFTSQMMSMVKVARNQMYNVLTTVRSYMSQISGATNKSINLKVNKSVTTSNVGGVNLPVTPAMASAFYAANAASTLSMGDMGALAHSNSYGMSTGGGGSSFSGSSSGSMTIEIPVMLDGRELARASAKYVNNELKLIANRENRKRGAK